MRGTVCSLLRLVKNLLSNLAHIEFSTVDLLISYSLDLSRETFNLFLNVECLRTRAFKEPPRPSEFCANGSFAGARTGEAAAAEMRASDAPDSPPRGMTQNARRREPPAAGVVSAVAAASATQQLPR